MTPSLLSGSQDPHKPYAPAIPADEGARLATLHDLDILDTPADERFDRLTRLAAELFEVPIALVSLVDERRQWFKSVCGLEMRETPRDLSFCAHALNEPNLLMIEDTLKHPRFAEHPLVIGEPYLRFYAGAIIRGPDGQPLGTLCIADRRPRRLDARERASLRRLAELAESEIEREAELNQRFRRLAEETLFDPASGLPGEELLQRRLQSRIGGAAEGFEIALLREASDPADGALVGEAASLRQALAERMAELAEGTDLLAAGSDGILYLARPRAAAEPGWDERLRAQLAAPVRLAAGRHQPQLLLERCAAGPGASAAECLAAGRAALERAVAAHRQAVREAQVEAATVARTAELERVVDERTRALEEFLQAVTHDLREPLNQMDTYAELIQADSAGSVSGQALEDLRSIREAAARMSELIGALRELARLGRSELQVAPVSLEACVAAVLADLAQQIQERGARVGAAPAVTVAADGTLLRAVYQNLVSNALRHGGDAPSIRFSHERTADGDVLGVADDGPGIAAEARDSVFRPFVRLRGRGSGSGLGLTLVARIVGRHGGHAWIESAPEGGTHVRWLLPATQP